MSDDQFLLDHLVCEVPTTGAASGFAWYELDADDPDVVRSFAASVRPAPARVIAATRRGAAGTADELIPELSGDAITHVQFEAVDVPRSRVTVDALGTIGIDALPACHLDAAPARPDLLRAAAERLAVLGTDLIKLVFPATEAQHLRWAEELLQQWPHQDVGLSLTPAGSRQGRLRAALAGSRLVFAPLTGTAERMSAYWYREMVTEPAADRLGAH
jgi:hypothetical protein